MLYKIYEFLFLVGSNQIKTAQSTGALEYTDYFSAEE